MDSPGGLPRDATTLPWTSCSDPGSTPVDSSLPVRTPNKRSTLRSSTGSALAAADVSMQDADVSSKAAPNTSALPALPPAEIWKCVLGLRDCDDEDIGWWLHCARWKGNIRDSVSSKSSSLYSSTKHSSTYTNRTSVSDLATASSRTSCYESPSTDSPRQDVPEDPVTLKTQSLEQLNQQQYHSPGDPLPPTSGPWKRLPELPSRNSIGPSKKPVPKQIHFCTFCSKECARKSDWIRHEEEFHEPQERYPCPNCKQQYPHKDRFLRHHKSVHGCQNCVHADIVRVILEPKRYFGCGFCGQCILSWETRKQHMAEHQIAGMKKQDWDHSLVIWGLLSQDQIHTAWTSLLTQHFGNSWPWIIWDQRSTIDLQERLERGEDEERGLTSEIYWSRTAAESIVRDAFTLASKIFPGIVAENDRMDSDCEAVADVQISCSLRNRHSLMRPDSGVFPDQSAPGGPRFNLTCDPGSDTLLEGVVEPRLLSLHENHASERFFGEVPSLYSAVTDRYDPFALSRLGSAHIRTKSPLRRLAHGLDRPPGTPDHVNQNVQQARPGDSGFMTGMVYD